MAIIKVDFNEKIGKIKPLHGVGQPPFTAEVYECPDFSMISYLKEAGIPYSRLHDVGGAFGGNRFVDIPNVFRDFDADPYEPASYDFAFTDQLITALINNGVEPVYRLGVSIEGFSSIKYYRIVPPKDFMKWAIICEHIIRHYTEGWADGFRYDMKYWEIWNEPDNNGDINRNNMWRGTKEQYYELYEIASKHIKKCFPHLKVGGYAGCGFYVLTGRPSANTGTTGRYEYFMDFFKGFMKHIKENNCPLDFFTWHSYDWIEPMKVYADFVRKALDEAGYTNAESICNEWCCDTEDIGKAKGAAYICGMILAMQDMPIDGSMVYDARFGIGPYCVLFNPATSLPYPAFYGMKAFNELYKRGNQVLLTCDQEEVYAVAAAGEADGYIVIDNYTQKDISISLDLQKEIVECFLINEENHMTQCDLPEVLKANDILCVRVLL